MEEKKLTDFYFKDGELHAPVEDIYKQLIKQVIHKNLDDIHYKMLHPYLMTFLKKGVYESDLFKKTSKSFKEDVEWLLDLSFEEMYELVKGEPYVYIRTQYIEEMTPEEEEVLERRNSFKVVK